ncbi:hypothetical protein JNW91_19660 [Micromonospora sp. STR1_7]|uniref:Aminoglycoside phosphotransferase domain-containing protein n=1 Tax=Micromonospora parastrephiae TaxID=2806101 RepID=A0ABS1XXA2_9ACTN|nr:hypothetical protein [Micromonospora parastrephiae]MBM0233872.1 hypothetical protein [Micromonospora parastrephiae]
MKGRPTGMNDGLDDLMQDPAATKRLRRWAELRGGTVRAPSRPLRTRGFTDAYLVTITFSRRGNGPGNSTQKLIVKVQGRGTKEPERHEQAWLSNEDFAKRHLVRQPYGGLDVDDDRIMTFQEVANDGGPVTTLDDIDEEYLVPTFATVTDRVLNDWNRRPSDAGLRGRPIGTTTIGDYIRGELTVAGVLAEVPHLAARVGLPDPSSDWLVIDGVVLPNPLRLVAPDAPEQEPRIDYVQGYAHGDLHGGNILIPLDGVPRPTAFRLVDLSAFAEDAPLTRDLVCLLLTTVLRHVAPRLAADGPGLPTTQADALVNKLLHPIVDRPSLALPRLLDDLVNSAHLLVQSGAKGGWGPEWRTQYRLSMISQALICTTFDNLSQAGRRWCFRLAAEAYNGEFFPSAARPAPAGLPVLPRLASDMSAQPRTPARPPVPRAASGGVDLGWSPSVTAEQGSLHAEPSRPVATAVRTGNAPMATHAGPTDNSIRPDPWVGNNRSNPQRPGPFGDGVPQPRRPLNDGLLWSRSVAKRRTIPRTRLRLITAAVLSGVSLSTAVGCPTPIGLDRPRGTTTLPTRTVPEGADRGASRDEASQRLTDLALKVAELRDPPPPGPFTFTCRQVWALEARDKHEDQKILFQEVRLWWNSRLSGRSITVNEEPGRRTEPPDDDTYAEGELSEVLPLPAANATELRDQLARLAPRVRRHGGTQPGSCGAWPRSTATTC